MRPLIYLSVGLLIQLISELAAARPVDEYLSFGPVSSDRQRTVVWLRNKLQSSVPRDQGPEATLSYLEKLLNGINKLRQGSKFYENDNIADALVRFERIGSLEELEKVVHGLIELADLDNESFCTSSAVKDFILTFRAINFDSVKGLQELYPAGDNELTEAAPKLYEFMRHYAPLHHQRCWSLLESLFDVASARIRNSEERFDALIGIGDVESFDPHADDARNLSGLKDVCSEFRPHIANFADVWQFGRLLYAYPASSDRFDRRINNLLEYSRICLQLDNPSVLEESKGKPAINRKSSNSYLSQDTA